MALLGAILSGCATSHPTLTTTPPSAGATTASPSETKPAERSAPTAGPTQPAVPALGATSPTDLGSRSESPLGPLTESNLWDRIRSGFAMPALDSALVAEKERFYLQRPEYLQRMFQRGGRYLFYIVEEVERRGLPTELALLPFVESAMNPVALSHAAASGLWQFIPSTGKQYNLSQNWWVDNRRDVTRSTHAALDYLQKIYAMQGNDWFLALASYNWGEGAVQRAVKKAQAKGKSGDYLSLDMPNETRHYVPKLIALKNIIARSQALGLQLPVVPNKPYFVTVEKTRPIDLKLAAQFAGMSVDEFVALNPAHNRPVIAASKNNELKIPADRVDGFMAAVNRHSESNKALTTWQPYTLQAGESLESIARREGVSVAELEKANSLRGGARLLSGTTILAPHRNGPVDEAKIENFVAPRLYERVDQPAAYHVVGRKETVGSIAGQYGISAATLKAWNGIKKGVTKGTRLLVRPAASQTLLTNEQGQRSVVASHAQPVPVVALSEPAATAPVPRSAAARHPSPKSKALGANRPQTKVISRSATQREPTKPAVKAVSKGKDTRRAAQKA